MNKKAAPELKAAFFTLPEQMSLIRQVDTIYLFDMML
jgi:hypothetical protein